MHKSNHSRSADAYFHNERIRQYLINAGLINRRGDIVPRTTYEIVLAERSKPTSVKTRPSLTVTNYVVEKERKPRVVVHHEPGTSAKRSQELTRALNNSYHIEAHPRSRSTRKPSSTSHKRAPVRVKSAHRSPPRTQNRFVRRSATAKERPKDEFCQVTMVYYGSPLNLDSSNDWYQPHGDTVVVMQQHSNDENLLVYKGCLKPNETFTFESRRHPAYPFAVTLYVNGCIDSRISVCCEYKHKVNVRLGGSRGSFGVYDVQKSHPCQNCRFESYEKEAGTSRGTSARSESRRTLSPLSKDRTESPRSERIQANEQSRTLDPTSRPRNKVMMARNDESSSSEHEFIGKGRVTEENLSSSSSDISEETLQLSPEGLDEPEEFPFSSETWLSTRYNDVQQSNDAASSWVSPMHLSGNEEDRHTRTSSSSASSNGSDPSSRSALHQNQPNRSLSSTTTAATSTSIPSFNDDKDSTIAKQHTSASSSSSLSLGQVDEPSSSRTSARKPSIGNESSRSHTTTSSISELLLRTKENGHRSLTSSGQSNVKSTHCMINERRHRPLRLPPNDISTSDDDANSTLIL